MRYSNIVPKTRCYSDIRLQTCRDLEIRVKGHLRSLKVVPFNRNRLCMVSYYYHIVTLSVRRAVIKIFDNKKYRDLENRIKGP